MNYTSRRIVCRRPFYLLVSFHCLDSLVSTFRPRFSSHAPFFFLSAHSRTTYLPRGILKFARDFVAKMIEKRYDKKKKKIHRGDKKLKKPLETSSSMERLITRRALSFHSSESSTKTKEKQKKRRFNNH